MAHYWCLIGLGIFYVAAGVTGIYAHRKGVDAENRANAPVGDVRKL